MKQAAAPQTPRMRSTGYLHCPNSPTTPHSHILCKELFACSLTGTHILKVVSILRESRHHAEQHDSHQ